MAETPLQPDLEPDTRPPTSLLTVAAALLRRWRWVALGGLIGGGAAAGWALLATPRYRSTAKFAPEERTLPSAGGLAALAGQLGAGTLGGTRSIQFYAEIATSRDVLEKLALDSFPAPEAPAHRLPLIDILDIRARTPAERLGNAVDYLQSKVIATTTNDRTGTIGLSVVLPDAHLAALVARRVFERVEEFNQAARRSSASERRRFAEREQEQAHSDLVAAEAAMRSFLEANRAGIDFPRLDFQRQQLQRRITLLSDLYARLARETQDARIEEVRETPVFTLVETPQVPVYRDFPRRTRMTITGGLLGAALAAALIAIGASGLSAKGLDPAGYRALRDALRRGRAA